MTEVSKQPIETKDYWTIIAMEVCGHVPVDIEPMEGRDGKNKVLVYSFGKNAAEDYDAWMRGEVGPKPKEDEEQSTIFETIRLVQRSATQFKNNLHRYCR